MKVTYDAEVAKAYGIPAAILLAKIAYLQRYSQRADGFCWKAVAEMAEETALTRHQIEAAAAKLEAAGLIETKVARARGHRGPVRHYRLTEAGKTAACFSEKWKNVFPKSGKTVFPESGKTTLENKYININTRANAGPAGGRSAARGKEEQRERELALEEEWAQEFAERKKAAGGAFTVFDGGKR